MKNIILLSAAFILYLTANAQITKGSTFLGGAFGISSSKTDGPSGQTSEVNSSHISVQFGKAIAENTILGFSPYLSMSKNEVRFNNNLQTVDQSVIGAAIFYRKYFPLAKRWSVFGEADLGAGRVLHETKTNNAKTLESKGFDVSAAIAPGLSFAAGKSFYLELFLNDLLSLNYQSLENQHFGSAGSTQESKTHSFSANANVSGLSNIAIGFRWIIPAKK